MQPRRNQERAVSARLAANGGQALVELRKKGAEMIRVRGRTIMVWWLILFTLLSLMGCSTTPTRYSNRMHPEYRQADFDRDQYECRRENTHPKVRSYSAGMEVDEEMAEACFRARGWSPSKD